MKRVKLTVAYDGTNYHGWQLQPNGITIEEVLNRELTALLGESIQVIGASRTDSGVHAMGNVAVFDTVHRMPADKICYALNQRLPDDIRVQSSGEVPGDWHPRKCNGVKTYEYKILNRRMEMPVFRFNTHFCYIPLDVDLMKQAADYLVGEHDFKSFCSVHSHVEDTVRTIYSLDVSRRQDVVTIRISGSGFLYNMVRIIAGTLMEIGAGNYPPEQMAVILNARNRQAAGKTAPAKGLTLISLKYEAVLAEWIYNENEQWNYNILQSHIKDEQIAYFLIERCDDEAWFGLLRKKINHSFQNGAAAVYLIDLEYDRLKDGDCYGIYQIDAITPEEMTDAMTRLTEEENMAIMEIHCMAERKSETFPTWHCARIVQKSL